MRAFLLRTVVAVALGAVFGPAPGNAQDRPARWQRRTAPVAVPVTVFHSTHAANLPTAETLRKGEWLFEVSHRFLPPISEGVGALWGFDGPAVNRLGLAFAATDRLMLGVLRSSQTDNLELNAKVRFLERDGPVRLMLGAMGGVAWNTDPPEVRDDIGTPVQGYAQMMLNLGTDRWAVGLVPTWLHNPLIEAEKATDVFSLGLHAQAYLSPQVSVLGEWIAAQPSGVLAHDAASLALELETGGHFFKIVVTNQPRMNPAQHLAGSPFAVSLDQLRMGFNITRLLSF